MNISFYNIFLNTHINTEYLELKCIFDSQNVNSSEKKYDHLTHVGKLKGDYIKSSILRSEGSIIDDLALLLSIALGNQVFSDAFNLGRIGKNKSDINLLMQEDIEDFINLSLDNLQKISPEYQNILRTAIHMYYQSKYYLWFDDLRDILLMNCFEFIIMSIYRIDKSIGDKEIDFTIAYSFLIKKFGYQEYVDTELEKEITSESVKDFKKRMQVSSFGSFSKQFREMRNWIAHGKNHKKPLFTDSPSDSEFTFEYRLDSFIRVIVVDLIYEKSYKRKFDILYQLILEKNVCIMPTPEFPKLRFQEVKSF